MVNISVHIYVYICMYIYMYIYMYMWVIQKVYMGDGRITKGIYGTS